MAETAEGRRTSFKKWLAEEKRWEGKYQEISLGQIENKDLIESKPAIFGINELLVLWSVRVFFLGQIVWVKIAEYKLKLKALNFKVRS